MNDSEVLFTIAEKCPAKNGIVPITNRKEKTVTMHYHDLLMESPYCFTYQQARKEVHENRRGKTDLKLNSYDMRRSELCKIWGWGVHADRNGKLALVGCETDEYQRLLKDSSVRKIKALNPSASQIKSFHNKFPNL